MLCHITAKVVKPTVRQLLHRRPQRRRLLLCWRCQRYFVAVVYESRSSISTFRYIITKIVELPPRQQYRQQCRWWIRRWWCHILTIVYESWSSVSESIATTSQHSSHLVPVTSSHRSMSSDLASRKSHDLSTHGPLCPAPSPYDSNADSCDGNDSDGGGDHTSPQWTMSPGLPSDATSQQAYDLTITVYSDVDYVVSSQPSPTG